MTDISFVDEYSVGSNYNFHDARTYVEESPEVTENNCPWPPNPNIFFPEDCPKISKLFQPDCFVDTYLEGVVLQCKNLALVKNHKILLRHDHWSMEDQVKILTGGPTGMEPLLSGFIGPGMLTGAVFGQVTASPPTSDILAALKLLSMSHRAGIVVIVMNNLADRLNFGFACQQAAHEGIKVICLTVGEDCSGASVNKQLGKRGSSGIVFLYKIAGAMAADKRSLYEIHCVLKSLQGKSLGSINVVIQQNTMKIDSSPKVKIEKYISEGYSVSELVEDALHFILNPTSYFSIHVVKGDNVAIIVNNLGNLYDLYLTIILREVLSRISKMGIHIVRLYHGRFFTSGTQPSFSISVLKVTDNIVKWLDSSVQVNSWPFTSNQLGKPKVPLKWRYFNYIHKKCSDATLSHGYLISPIKKMKNLGPRFKDGEAYLAVEALRSVITTISNMEEYLNKLDYDKDFGSTIRIFMNNIKMEIDSKTFIIVSPYGLFNHLSELAGNTAGGVVGPLFSILFTSASQVFLSQSFHRPLSWGLWMDAARTTRDSLCSFTRVSPGDGTILDALSPFVKAFDQPTVDCLAVAVEAAKCGAEETASQRRSGLPDPGAVALSTAFGAIFPLLEKYLTEPDKKTTSSSSDCSMMTS